jgi:hypothetical protein
MYILAILPQTFPGERALGILPVVDLALPAFVGPRGGAKADQRREREGHSGGNCTVSPGVSSTVGSGYPPLCVKRHHQSLEDAVSPPLTGLHH